jgi:hypothetical protein
MTERATETSARTETKAALACRLRHRIGRRGSSPTAGEVEIENVLSGVVEIEVSTHPLQHLNLVITDVAGRPVPAPPYGHLFSPREQPYVFRLGPGEKYTHNVSLLGTIAEDQQSPGTYTVRAVYEYNGIRAVSEPVQVTV